MKVELFNTNNSINRNLFNYSILLSIFLILPLTLIVGGLGLSGKLAVFISIPFILLVIFDFRLIYILLIVTLFIPFTYQRLFVSVFFSIILIISFLVTHKNISIRDFDNPLTKPAIVFVLLSIPSLYNTPDIIKSLMLMYNFVSIVFILLVTVASIREFKEITKLLNIFLVLVFIDGLYVYYEGIVLNQRGFGFGGIMFVDFVGIAIIISFINVIFYSSIKRYLYLLLFFFFTLASFFTQTRTSWLAIASTVILLLTSLYFLREKLAISRKIVPILFFIILTAIIPLVLSQNSITSSVEERTSNLTELEGSFNEEGMATNSLITRLLIWHTAFNAFMEHPIIGIGSYSFPFASKNYYEIPKFLYRDYVEGLTPHQTFFAVLAETGIVGFGAFSFFIYMIFINSIKTIKYVTNKSEQRITFLLFWSTIYILISMFLTDAWLWGPGGVFLGIILGLAMSNRKLLLSKKSI